jgi:hypothetical protein
MLGLFVVLKGVFVPQLNCGRAMSHRFVGLYVKIFFGFVERDISTMI